MTRLWPAGCPISVTNAGDNSNAGHARPVNFAWQNQTHRVDEITREWRVDIDWWRGRVWRDYFKVSTDTGLLVIIFQDLVSGEWYLQRLYD
jgi:hypothetical protein